MTEEKQRNGHVFIACDSDEQRMKRAARRGKVQRQIRTARPPITSPQTKVYI